MPVVEQIGRGGQASESSSVRRRYFARDYSSEASAMAGVLAYLQSTLGDPPLVPDAPGAVLKNITADETSVEDAYECEATWGQFQKPEPKQAGESSFNFEIGVTPIRVVVPIATTVYGDSPPTIYLIGDQNDGQPPAGVDVYEPTHTESETHIIPAASIDALKSAAKARVGKMNAFSWKGHEPGEVLLQGVSGAKRGSSDWECTFRWGVRENQTNLVIAGITVAQKKGWDYLWPRHQLTEDETSLTHEITHIVVQQVFRTAAMSGLGIGS